MRSDRTDSKITLNAFPDDRKSQMLFAFCFLSKSYLMDPVPTTYMDNYPIELLVGNLQSSKFMKPLPYNIGDLFCLPSEYLTEYTLLDNMVGQQYSSTPYKFYINRGAYCKSTCKKIYTPEQKELLYHLIDNQYKIYFYCDGIPVSVLHHTIVESQTRKYLYGFDIGFKETHNSKRGLVTGYHYMYTHLNISIDLNYDHSLGLYRVLQLEVIPVAPPNKPPCTFEFPDSIENSTEFLFTYSLEFKNVDDKPGDRWKLAVEKSHTPTIQWTSLANTLIGVFSGSIIFYGFFTQYIRSLVHNQNGQQMRGWKSLKSDVFRPPRYSLMWASLISNGIHVLVSSLVVILAAIMKILSPAKVSFIPKVWAITYFSITLLIGFLNQYLFASTGAAEKKFAALKTSILSNMAPLVIFTFLLAFENKSGSLEFIPIHKFIIIIFLLLFSAALHATGTIICIIVKRFKGIGECSAFPKNIPKLPLYLVPEVSETFIGFCVYAVFIPMLDILIRQVWAPYGIWKIWGIFFGSCCSSLVLSSVLSLGHIFIRLQHEDYEWWWTSFKGPALSGFFVFMHMLGKFMLSMYTSEVFVSLTYVFKCLLFSLIFGLSCGAIGALSSMVLIRYLYRKKL